MPFARIFRGLREYDRFLMVNEVPVDLEMDFSINDFMDEG